MKCFYKAIKLVLVCKREELQFRRCKVETNAAMNQPGQKSRALAAPYFFHYFGGGQSESSSGRSWHTGLVVIIFQFPII